MDRSSDVKLWEPNEAETLNGAFHFEGGPNWAVRTDDGTIWLLEFDAEKQLEALGPDEGQGVQVLYSRDGRGRPAYDVTLD